MSGQKPSYKTEYDLETNLYYKQQIGELLRHKFKLEKFQGIQERIIECSLTESDLFAILRSGGGKSLTYQLPGLIQEGTYIVVQPLLSLIQDQMQSLEALKIPTFHISTPTPNLEIEFQAQNPKFIFLTPEKFQSCSRTQYFFQRLAEKKKVRRIVMDEAHCISEMGFDFRPSYRELYKLRSAPYFVGVPVTCLTATAPQWIIDDVATLLRMREPYLFKDTFNRPNLFYEILRRENINPLEYIKKLALNHYPGCSGIIYCSTKQECEDLAKKLYTDFKINSDYYHAGISDTQRDKVFQQWKSNQIQVIVATVALGMGIDKPDVRFVVNYGISDSMENYQQETGRAGRDGQRSDCVMFYGKEDLSTKRYLHLQGARDTDLGLQKMREYCENVTVCRRKQLLGFFGEEFDEADCKKMCDNCFNRGQTETKQRNVFDQVRDLLTRLQAYKQKQSHYITVSQLKSILRGQDSSIKVEWVKQELQMQGLIGLWKHFSAEQVDQLIQRLLNDGILVERKKGVIPRTDKPFMEVLLQEERVQELLKRGEYFLVSTKQHHAQGRLLTGAPLQPSKNGEKDKERAFVPLGMIQKLKTQNPKVLIPSSQRRLLKQLQEQEEQQQIPPRHPETGEGGPEKPPSSQKTYSLEFSIPDSDTTGGLQHSQKYQNLEELFEQGSQVKTKLSREFSSSSFQARAQSQKGAIPQVTQEAPREEQLRPSSGAADPFEDIEIESPPSIGGTTPREKCSPLKLEEPPLKQEEVSSSQFCTESQMESIFQCLSSQPQSQIQLRESILKKKVFLENFGYLTDSQFEQLFQRLKVLRKEIHGRLQDTTDLVAGVESVADTEFLKIITKYLVENNDDLNSITKQIREVTPSFLQNREQFFKIVKEFRTQHQIDKSLYQVPEIIDSDDDLSLDFEQDSRKRSFEYEEEGPVPKKILQEK